MIPNERKEWTVIPNDRHELSEYLAREDEEFMRAEKREAMIYNERLFLLGFGGKCYPWTLEHITEACGQIEQEIFRSAAEMDKKVYEYWYDVADRVAEKNVDEAMKHG